jgi:hypothetical protein
MSGQLDAPAPFTPGERAPDTYWRGGSVTYTELLRPFIRQASCQMLHQQSKARADPMPCNCTVNEDVRVVREFKMQHTFNVCT